MSGEEFPGLEEFLKDYPEMRIAPARNGSLILRGGFEFSVPRANRPHIADSYALKIEVPVSFPTVVPLVTETSNKISRDDKHHVNPDHTLCLGLPLRLLWKLKRAPTLVGFAEECLVPYLYSISHKLQYGTFPFGELEHGKPGVISDYLDLFGLKSREQVLRALELLGMKKRLANKKPCPCGCGKRLGACRYHIKMAELRELASRPWFRQHLATLGSGK